MNKNVEQFISSIKIENSKKVMQHVFKRVDVDSIENYSPIQMEQLILDAKINSPKEIVTIIYVLSSYAKWLQEQGIVKSDDMYEVLQSIDKKLLWKKLLKKEKK